MNMVAIDTVSSIISVSAAGPAGRCTMTFESTVQHAETLTDLLEKTITIAGFTPRETRQVVCAEGPGSFTGLRIAYAAAKGLQFAADCPLVAVPTLYCYAHPFLSWNGTLISVMDARKNRFYTQCFVHGKQTGEPQDNTPEEIFSQLDQKSSVLVTGPDADLFISRADPEFDNSRILSIPSGKNGISSVMIEIALGGETPYTCSVPDYAGPRYVRKSDAENARKQ